MKKITIITLPCQLLALALIFIFSCENRSDRASNGGNGPDSAMGSRYILASSLALAAEIAKSSFDQQAIKALHKTEQEETAEATSNYTFIACCCPCYQTFDSEVTSAVQPPEDSRRLIDTAIMDAQAITRRDSTGHCPCPSAMEIIAKTVQQMTAVLDGQKIAPEEQKGKLEGWTVFKINEKILTEGRHTLQFEGVFFGKEFRKYEIPFLIDNSKPYFLDK